jgi:hypothetical protein
MQVRCLYLFFTVFNIIKGEMKMAINPVAQTDAAKVTAQTAAVNADKPQSAAPQPAPVKPQATTDTVLISNSAKAMMQEAQETAAQTAQEAAKGDHQAQRMLAKEAAARAEQQGNNQPSVLRPQ